MILENTLRIGIAELPANSERASFSLPHGPWTARLSLEQHDAIGCRLWDLRLSRATPLGATPKEWAGTLAERVTGLLEPLKLHEADDARQLTTLRSQAPTSRGDALQYYEVELQGLTELQLRRYQGFREPGKKREQVAFTLTYEGLAKLLGDVAPLAGLQER